MDVPTQPAEHRSPLAQLVAAIRQLDGLTAQVGPFALYSDAADRAPRQLAAVCAALGVPLTFDHPVGLPGRDFAVVALGAEIQRVQRLPGLADIDVSAAVARACRHDVEQSAGYRVHTLPRPDGTVLTAVEAGPAGADCVLLSPPCGMDFRLCLPWLRALAPSYRCVIPQARGTSEPITDPQDFDRRGYGVDEQVEDLLAVADRLGSGPMHVMGLCGGATVALAAAARRGVASVSLWYADLELGGGTPKTDHQINLREMLDLAGESRDSAEWLRGKLTSGPLTGVPERIGPLVVRPYATTELFYRYARLAAATMHFDSRPVAAGLDRPLLVVTSADDQLAHPAGSRRMAEIVSGARLVVAEHGTHLDAFRATADQVEQLTGFLTGVSAG